jgi:hypothetical protein
MLACRVDRYAVSKKLATRFCGEGLFMAQQQEKSTLLSPVDLSKPAGSGDAANRQNMFDECYCQTGTGRVTNKDVEIKEEAARKVFGQPAPKDLANVFLEDLGGGPSMRKLLENQVIHNLKDEQRRQYRHESVENAKSAIAAWQAAEAQGQRVNPDTMRNMHLKVAYAEAGIECHMIQQVWATMNDDQRQKLDLELDAKLKAAHANQGVLDNSTPAANSALGQFDSSVVSLVRDYLNQR